MLRGRIAEEAFLRLEAHMIVAMRDLRLAPGTHDIRLSGYLVS